VSPARLAAQLKDAYLLGAYYQSFLLKTGFERDAILAPPLLIELFGHDFVYDQIVTRCLSVIRLPQPVRRVAVIGCKASKTLDKFVANLNE
jgi:hypothetical protein